MLSHYLGPDPFLSRSMDQTMHSPQYRQFGHVTGHFTFWISLSLRISSLIPKFGLRPKISQKVKSFFFVWLQRLAERLAETELQTERSLNPKLINSPVDFACTR